MTPTTPPLEPPLTYRPAEVARLLGVDRLTVYKFIREGRLAARHAGRRTLLIERAALERFLADLPVCASAEAAGDVA
jgi:excisionase family DNA binding protein